MKSVAFFSIRGILALVAVFAAMFATLRCANHTTVLVMHGALLCAAVVLVVIAVAGGTRGASFPPQHLRRGSSICSFAILATSSPCLTRAKARWQPRQHFIAHLCCMNG